MYCRQHEGSVGTHHGWLALAIAAGFILASVTSAHAQRRARVRGVVSDASGAPLAGVAVTAFNASFAPDTFTAESDEKGRWAMIGFGDMTADWMFSFELSGYETVQVSHEVKPSGRNKALNVTMQRVSETGATAEATDIGTDAVNPDNYWDGVAAFEGGDYAAAITSWKAFVADNPEAYAVWLRLAEAYIRSADDKSARAAYERVLQLAPEQPTALFMLASLSAQAGELDAALGLFERVVEQDPENPSLYYNIGEIYFQQGRAEEAARFYVRAVAVEPTYAAAYKQLGFAQVNAGNIPEAITAFEKFLDLAPPEGEDAAMVTGVLDALRKSQ